MEFNKNYLVKQTENGFEEGDIVSFKRSGQRRSDLAKWTCLTRRLRIECQLTVVPLSENDINKKVITKAVAWGMKVFGDFAPTSRTRSH